jgi:hypothetical protein
LLASPLRSRFIPRRLDPQPLPLPRNGEEPAHAVSLPAGGVHNRGEGSAGAPPDQREDFRALAPSARLGRRGGLLRLDGLGRFLGPSRTLLVDGTLFKESFFDRAVRSGAATAAACSVFSTLVMSRPFLRCERTTICPSGSVGNTS